MSNHVKARRQPRPVDRSQQAPVEDGNDAALLANEVVMMVRAGSRELVSGPSAAEVQLLHEAFRLHHVQHAVNGDATHAGRVAPRAGVDLLGVAGAAKLNERPKHRP